jgi:O-succinylbenzoic acid--CoA ligase
VKDPHRWPRRDLLAHRAATTPDRVGLVDAEEGQTATYRDLDQAVSGLASWLDGLGVTTTTRVGVLLEPGPAFVRLVHALFRLGAVVVPLDPRATSTELEPILDRAAVTVLVADGDTAATAADVAGHVEKTASVAEYDPAATDGESVWSYPWSPDREALVLFTSGTTGQPKGVRLTAGNLRASAEASAYRLGVTPDDRWLDCLPMHHMGGLAPIVRTALYGTTLVVQRSFDPAETIRVIEAERITGLSVVPTMLDRLLAADWDPPTHLRTVLLGGAPASDELIDRCDRRGVPVSPTYGMTETASQIATATPEQAFAHRGTVGQPLLNTRVTIVADGSPVETGERGELVVAGPTVTPGYLAEAATAEAFGEYGLHTGDVGYRDAAGRLWIDGRVDDRIVTGGENVDPTEVATVLRGHPAVDEAAVLGVPDETWGQRVVALVVADDLAGDALDEHCRAALAAYKCPKSYEFVEAVPRTDSGTVDREIARRYFDQDS